MVRYLVRQLVGRMQLPSKAAMPPYTAVMGKHVLITQSCPYKSLGSKMATIAVWANGAYALLGQWHLAGHKFLTVAMRAHHSSGCCLHT